MASKIKVDQIQTADGSGTIALQNQLSGMTSASMPTGSVIQTVQVTGAVSRTTVTSTGSWTSHFSLSITPSSTSNKILVLLTAPVRLTGNSNLMRAGFRVERGSTTIWNTGDFVEHMQIRNADGEVDMLNNIQYLDSPSTTSSTTYTFQAYLHTGTGMYLWEKGYGTNMVLMEIAG